MSAMSLARNAGAISPARIITYVWLFLCAITVLSWWLGHGDTIASVPITVAVIVIGAVKSRLILRTFMEVEHGPTWLKVSTDAWLVALWGTVLAIYLY